MVNNGIQDQKDKLLKTIKIIFYKRRTQYQLAENNDQKFIAKIEKYIKPFLKSNNTKIVEYVDNYIRDINHTNDKPPQEYMILIDQLSELALLDNKVFSWEIFLDWYENNIVKSDFIIPTDITIKSLIDSFLILIENETKRCFCVLPLPKLRINKSIHLSDNIHIINTRWKSNNPNKKFFSSMSYYSDISQKQLVSQVRRFCHLSKEENEKFDEAISNILKYSKGFLLYPLLIIQDTTVFDTFEYYSKEIGNYIKCYLKVIALVENFDCDDIEIYMENNQVKHYLVFNSMDYNTKALRTNTLFFPYIINANKMYKHLDFFKSFIFPYKNDDVIMNIYKESLKSFCWDDDSNYQIPDYFFIRLVLMFSALERLFLGFSGMGSKKHPLANVISKLYTKRFPRKKVIKKAIINMYDARSNFVHNHNNHFVKYLKRVDWQNTTEKEMPYKIDDDSFEIFKQVVAQIYEYFPQIYNNFKNSVRPTTNKIKDEWYKYCKQLSR